MDLYIEYLPLDLREAIHFENLIFQCTNESIEESKKLLRKFSPKWIQKMIYYCGFYRELSYKLLGDVFELSGPPEIKFYEYEEFSQYLLIRNLITPNDLIDENKPNEIEEAQLADAAHNHYSSDFSYMPKTDMKKREDFEDTIKENTLQYFVKNDNVSAFTDFIAVKNIDVQRSNIYILDLIFTIIDFSAYCGSINIFKYLMLNRCEITSRTIKYAVVGGNEDIIEFLANNGYSFDNKEMDAISYHNNRVVKWLFEHYQCGNDVNLVFCLDCFNMEIFFYLHFEKGIDLNQVGYMHFSPFMVAAFQDNIPLVKYFLSLGTIKMPIKENEESSKVLPFSQRMRDVIKEYIIAKKASTK